MKMLEQKNKTFENQHNTFIIDEAVAGLLYAELQ